MAITKISWQMDGMAIGLKRVFVKKGVIQPSQDEIIARISSG